MSLIKWEPLREIEGMFDRYTGAMGMPSSLGRDLIEAGDWTPRVDISETDKDFVIKAEVPEVDKKDVKVTVDNGVLTMQGERKQEKEEKEEKDKRFHRVERFYGSFVRSFTLPDNVDETNIDAKFKDGMLTLTLLKTEKSSPKKIEVKVH